MTRFLPFLFSLLLLTAAPAAVNVQRPGGEGADKNDLTTDVSVASGKTLDIKTGGTLALSGNTTANGATLTPTELSYIDGLDVNVKSWMTSTTSTLSGKLDSSTAATTYAPINNATFTGTVTLPAVSITGSAVVPSGGTLAATGSGTIAATTLDGYTTATLPVSTATQTALDLKANNASGAADSQVWMMPTFMTGDESMYLATSGNGVDWKILLGHLYTNPSSGKVYRDPSTYYQATTGTWFQVHSNVTSGSFASSDFSVVTSKDLVNWTKVTDVSVSGANRVWSPEFFVDSDGSVSVFVAVSTNAGTSFAIYRTTPTNSAFSTWSNPASVYTGARAIDPFVILSGGTYHMFYKNEDTSYIEVATSGSVGGTYTLVNSGNWAGWGSGIEGPSVTRLPNGNYRLFVDAYQSTPIVPKYSESASLLSGWGALTSGTVVNSVQGVFEMRHGTPYLMNVNQQRSLAAAISNSSQAFRSAITKSGITGAVGIVTNQDTLQAVRGSYAQRQIWHVNGTDPSYNALTEAVSNGSYQGFKGFSATGGTFLWDCNMSTGAQDWYGAFKIRGVLSAGSGPTTITDSAGKVLSTALNTVAVSQGGTGATTLTGLVKGNGTSAMTAAAAGTDYVVPAGNVATATALLNVASHYTDTTSTSTNGTEDDLYSDTLTAGILSTNGSVIEEVEHVGVIGSATAARRIKKYFGGTLIFDSGSLTLSLGGEFSIETFVIRESSSVVRCTVAVTSTSASTVPYSTYTRITGLTLANTQVLKTTGIASGTGAASGDIINRMAVIKSSVQ